MPGFFLHVGGKMQCSHLATVPIIPMQTRVSVSGQFVAIKTNRLLPSGCTFQVPVAKPQPCVNIRWANVSSRVTILGQPILLQSPPGRGTGNGVGETAEKAPQVLPNAPTILSMQVRVSGI